MTSTPTSSPRPALVIASAVTVVCSLPTFLVGAMAVQLARDLGFGTVGIGGAVATFFGTMALASVHLGRFVDRLGAVVSLRLAVVAATVASLGCSVANSRWVTLAGWLVLSGLAAALAQPAANRLLINRIRADRLGTAFGLKQSAPPIASMLAGLSVPTIALTIGWRWGFGLVALAAALVGLAVRSLPLPAASPGGVHLARRKLQPLRDRSTLAVLSFGFGLAFVASSSVLAFYVDAAVFSGTSHRDAGLIFAVGSLLAIATRVAAGVAADRFEFSPLRFSALLLGAGAVGLVLLGTARPAAMGVGAIIALGGTWGFPGLFWFALVSAFPDTPGRVTGAMAPSAIGGVVGPVGFGALATAVGYPFAWRLAGVLAMISVGALIYGAHRLAAMANRAAAA